MRGSRFDREPVDLDADDTSWAIPATSKQHRAIDSGQDRNTFRVLREHYKRQCMAARAECWLCGNVIDYHTASGPRSFQLDHAIPVAYAPELAMDPNNFRAAHALCNQRRATGDAVPITGEPSEVW